MAIKDNYMLSVVVPVGKLNGNIAALKSWIPTAKNIQIIMVLDHSDDMTRDAIQLSPAITNHPGIEIYQVDFHNPGDTRNFGLTRATGSWVLFADSDDVPRISNIEKAINSAKETEDIVVGNFETLMVTTAKITKHEVGNLNDLIKSLPKNLGLWRFVFRNKYLKEAGTLFPPLCMAEDQVFYLELNPMETRFKFTNMILYTYHVGNPFQLTSDSEKIQELRMAINLTFENISKAQSFRNSDFLSAQLFSLLGNSSKKYLVSNLLFILEISRKIIAQFGIRKLLLISSYPVRRFR
jgi:glycosyltransferase involved in cell wall biosynthesis